MSFAIFDPFKEMKRYRDFNNLVDWCASDPSCGVGGENSERGLARQGAIWKPTVDVSENDKELLVHCELPGLRRDEVNIEVDDGVLTLSGERKHVEKTKGEKYHKIERFYGKFQRSFTLPDNVDVTAIQACFCDGVLELRVPKPAPIEPPPKHRIEIRGGDTKAPEQ